MDSVSSGITKSYVVTLVFANMAGVEKSVKVESRAVSQFVLVKRLCRLSHKCAETIGLTAFRNHGTLSKFPSCHS